MPKKIHKSLQKYVSKITNSSSNKQIQLPIPCNRPKTSSFAIDTTHKNKQQHHQNDAATLSDIDQFLYENFKSLYQNEHDDAVFIKNDDSPKLLDPPPPRENLRGSSRFFVSSGSSSSQIIDEASTSSADRTAGDESAEIDPTAVDDFIALLTYSPSPYEDFRISMEEMVDARSERVDWRFLEELLFCYLDLNNKKAYRFILRAFVDLIVVLREQGRVVPVR